MNQQALAFDVYGTLVDPLQMSRLLEEIVGEKSAAMSQLWREKQLEYSFRRGLMKYYQDFSVCTRQALEYAQQVLGVSLSEEQIERLLSAYQQMDPYQDVIPALQWFKAQQMPVVAFSNGNRTMVTELLRYAGILPELDQVVSVDAVSSFKPDPEVYAHLCTSLDRNPENISLISSNPFDVIGAKVAGLKAIWVKRSPQAVFDPWGVSPDKVVTDLLELKALIAADL
ncbi:MAG: haloacid dehalogenase type II [Motiliproteus sp.]